MASSLFQLNYSEISNIIREMQAEQQQITEMLTKTSSMADEIVGRDWQGDAANKFHSEMHELYLVKLRKVANALGKMAMIAGKVSGHVREMDLSTKAFFKFD